MTESHQPPVAIQVLKRFWVALVLMVLIVVGVLHWFKNAFYDTGYAPEQPIAFYHKVHAGDLHIDCKYCHFNAERGKHAGVPPMSVCLGCHPAVATDNPVYQKEIANLVAIADTKQYQLGTTYHGDPNGVIYEGGVVHWKRVHKLPDHVYFSHQWHVRAGVACQTCHGPVQEMTTLRQFSDLTMEWCLDCHRNANYVGGRQYDPADPASFAVGTADRQTQRAQEQPDAVVEFVARQVRHAGEPSAGTPDVPASDQTTTTMRAGERDREHMVQTIIDEHGHDAEAAGTTLPPALQAAMKERLKDLPIWRLADLPETHRAFYQDPASFQNAPTQCNTCHQ